MKEIQTDFVIVGSGAGGATVAKELAAQGKRVLILEKGEESGGPRKPSLIKRIHKKYREGTLIRSVHKKLRNSIGMEKGIPVDYRIGVGGTTSIASANAVRSLEKELSSLGVSIENELQEIEQELGVAPFPQALMGNGAKKIWEAANSLGLKMEPMPKFIDFRRCDACGKCFCGCPTDAKWTAVSFLRKAQDDGASLLQNVMVNKVLTSNGRAIGVKATGPSGEIRIWADVVVLAAGAIGSPIILQKSWIESAGGKLFCDLYCYVYGPSESDIYNWEPNSIIDLEFLRKDGFVLVNSITPGSPKTIRHLPESFKSKAEKGMLGITVKIKDDSVGGVSRDGHIRKSMTSDDLGKLNRGLRMATEILEKAGVDRRYIKTVGPRGCHPGGTAAIGEVVDQNQETEIKNLFVSDASVLPTAPGLPPMLTIMALAKRLARVI